MMMTAGAKPYPKNLESARSNLISPVLRPPCWLLLLILLLILRDGLCPAYKHKLPASELWHILSPPVCNRDRDRSRSLTDGRYDRASRKLDSDDLGDPGIDLCLSM